MPYFYDKEILDFEVSSLWSEMWTISIGLGGIWTIPDKQDGLYEAFQNLPYKRLNRTRMYIEAPVSEDKAGIMNPWKHVYELATGTGRRGTTHHGDILFEFKDRPWKVG